MTAPTLELFYDGACPLCAREVRALKRRDVRQQIQFTDIAAPDFAPADYGRSLEDFMSQIHARTADGHWVMGFEVFRRVYDLLGWSLLVAPTRWPGISQLFDWAYQVFARNRLRLTGRCHDGTCR